MKKRFSFFRNVVELLIGILAVLGLLALLASDPLFFLLALFVVCLSRLNCSWKRTVRLAVCGLAILGCFTISCFLEPVFRSSAAKADALRIGRNGRSFVIAILTANFEREKMGQTIVWPSVSADFSGTQKDYTKAPDAETYFTDLMDSKCMDAHLGWFIFAGAGIEAAFNRRAFIQGDHNAWNVVAGLDENASDDTPFLFTRNLNITMDDLRNGDVDLRSRINSRIKPFGQHLVVVVRKGGAMEVLKARQLTRKSFLADAVFNDVTNRHATILKAKGMP